MNGAMIGKKLWVFVCLVLFIAGCASESRPGAKAPAGEYAAQGYGQPNAVREENAGVESERSVSVQSTGPSPGGFPAQPGLAPPQPPAPPPPPASNAPMSKPSGKAGRAPA